MNILLEQATRSKIFTIDTKQDSLSDAPALLQVECIGNISIIILFDCWHLPEPQSHLFHQISHLFSVIFDPTKEVQAWGNIHQLLLPFIRFNVFSITHLQHAHAFDLQQLFRAWYNRTFPHLGDCSPSDLSLIDEDTLLIHPPDYDLNLNSLQKQHDYFSCICPHRPYKQPNADWTVQMAIAHTFQEFLDTTYTLSPWGLGLDHSLVTYTPTDLIETNTHCALKKEKAYRHHLINSAVTDCLAITALSVPIHNQWSREQLQQHIKYLHTDDDPTDVYYNKNLLFTNSPPDIHDQSPTSDIIHVHNQLNEYEPISDDELPNVTNHKVSMPIAESLPDTQPINVTDTFIPIDSKKKRSQPAIRRRCQKRNAVKRAHRHDFNIIRTVHPCFKIQQVQQVLDNLHIRRRHCHIRRHYQLHIGFHSYADQVRYNNLFDTNYFSKSHYDQIFGSKSSSPHQTTVIH